MRAPNIPRMFTPVLNRLAKAPAAKRVAMAQDIYQQLTDLQSLVAGERRRAVRELRENGMTLSQVADKLGVSLSRVKQMEEGPIKAKLTPEQRVAKLERQLARAQVDARP